MLVELEGYKYIPIYIYCTALHIVYNKDITLFIKLRKTHLGGPLTFCSPWVLVLVISIDFEPNQPFIAC